MFQMFFCLVLLLVVFSCNSKKLKAKNDFEREKDISIRNTTYKIDTLIFADNWETENYFELNFKDSLVMKKKIKFEKNMIEINQTYIKVKDNYGNIFFNINNKIIFIKDLYQKKYDVPLDGSLHVMGNLTTAKRKGNYSRIDLVLVENNCLGDFCNDVEILSLKFKNNVFINCEIHEEDLNQYNL